MEKINIDIKFPLNKLKILTDTSDDKKILFKRYNLSSR